MGVETDADDPVGKQFDPFSFESADGGEVAWDPSGVVRAGDRETRPRCLAVHLFQPDCNACQEQARALQKLHAKRKPDEMAVLGIAHRGDAADAAAFARQFGVTYPIAVATGSDWAKKWASGDRMYILKADGEIVFSQEGFQESDIPVWQAVWADIREGRVVAFRHPPRAGEKLRKGDTLPAIELPDSMTGRTLALRVEKGKLTFTGGDGKPRIYRASVGFFSRY